MQKPKEKDLYVRVSEYGHDHPDGFGYMDIKLGLKLNEGGWEDKMIKSYMENALKSGETGKFVGSAGTTGYVNPNMDSMFFVIERGQDANFNSHKFILKYH